MDGWKATTSKLSASAGDDHPADASPTDRTSDKTIWLASQFLLVCTSVYICVSSICRILLCMKILTGVTAEKQIINAEGDLGLSSSSSSSSLPAPTRALNSPTSSGGAPPPRFFAALRKLSAILLLLLLLLLYIFYTGEMPGKAVLLCSVQ